MDLDQTQAIHLEDFDEGTDDEEHSDKTPVSYLKVLCQKGFPETKFPLYEGDNVIGRQQDVCNVYIPIKALSKQHACIEIRGETHLIYDKGSRNKTKRGKLYLSPEVRYELRSHDEICFADVSCVYLLKNDINTETCDSGSETGSESMFQTAPVTSQSAEENEGRLKFVEATLMADEEEDDNVSDASSDLLQPTQLYGTNLGNKAQKGRFDEAISLGFAEDSENSEDESNSSKVKRNVTVGETPVVTRVAPAAAGEKSSPEGKVNETLILDEEDDAVDKEGLLGAPTQAYVMESDYDDDEKDKSDSMLMGAATQAYGTATQAYGTATQAYGTATQAYGTATQAYGGSTPAYGGATQAYEEATQAYSTATDDSMEGETTAEGLTLAYDATFDEGVNESVLNAATQAYGKSPVKNKEGRESMELPDGDTQSFNVDEEAGGDRDNLDTCETPPKPTKPDENTVSSEAELDFFAAPTMACDLDFEPEMTEAKEQEVDENSGKECDDTMPISETVAIDGTQIKSPTTSNVNEESENDQTAILPETVPVSDSPVKSTSANSGEPLEQTLPVSQLESSDPKRPVEPVGKLMQEEPTLEDSMQENFEQEEDSENLLDGTMILPPIAEDAIVRDITHTHNKSSDFANQGDDKGEITSGEIATLVLSQDETPAISQVSAEEATQLPECEEQFQLPRNEIKLTQAYETDDENLVLEPTQAYDIAEELKGTEDGNMGEKTQKIEELEVEPTLAYDLQEELDISQTEMSRKNAQNLKEIEIEPTEAYEDEQIMMENHTQNIREMETEATQAYTGEESVESTILEKNQMGNQSKLSQLEEAKAEGEFGAVSPQKKSLAEETAGLCGEEVVPDSCGSQENTPAAIPLPSHSPHKSALASPKKRGISPKKVAFIGMESENSENGTVNKDKPEGLEDCETKSPVIPMCDINTSQPMDGGSHVDETSTTKSTPTEDIPELTTDGLGEKEENVDPEINKNQTTKGKRGRKSIVKKATTGNDVDKANDGDRSSNTRRGRKSLISAKTDKSQKDEDFKNAPSEPRSRRGRKSAVMEEDFKNVPSDSRSRRGRKSAVTDETKAENNSEAGIYSTRKTRGRKNTDDADVSNNVVDEIKDEDNIDDIATSHKEGPKHVEENKDEFQISDDTNKEIQNNSDIDDNSTSRKGRRGRKSVPESKDEFKISDDTNKEIKDNSPIENNSTSSKGKRGRKSVSVKENSHDDVEPSDNFNMEIKNSADDFDISIERRGLNENKDEVKDFDEETKNSVYDFDNAPNSIRRRGRKSTAKTMNAEDSAENTEINDSVLGQRDRSSRKNARNADNSVGSRSKNPRTRKSVVNESETRKEDSVVKTKTENEGEKISVVSKGRRGRKSILKNGISEKDSSPDDLVVASVKIAEELTDTVSPSSEQDGGESESLVKNLNIVGDKIVTEKSTNNGGTDNVSETVSETVSSPSKSRRGRTLRKSALILKKDVSDEGVFKEPGPSTRRGRGSKTSESGDEPTMEAPKPTRKGRSKKSDEASSSLETKQKSTRGQNLSASQEATINQSTDQDSEGDITTSIQSDDNCETLSEELVVGKTSRTRRKTNNKTSTNATSETGKGDSMIEKTQTKRRGRAAKASTDTTDDESTSKTEQPLKEDVSSTEGKTRTRRGRAAKGSTDITDDENSSSQTSTGRGGSKRGAANTDITQTPKSKKGRLSKKSNITMSEDDENVVGIQSLDDSKETPRGNKRRGKCNVSRMSVAETSLDESNDDDFKEPKRKTGKSSTLDTSLTSEKSSKNPRSKHPSSPRVKSSPSMVSDDLIGSPTTRRKSMDPKPKIAFTGVVDEHGQKITKELGGHVVSSVYDSTHLVTDKVRRTVKFLCCLARGLPIVIPQWLDSCKDAGVFVDPSPFIVKDKASEKQYKFCLQRSIEKASETSLLSGYKIHVTKSVRPDPPQMKDIIQCAGAEYLKSMPSTNEENSIVISCEDDKKLCEAAVREGVPVLTSEFLLTGILKQEILIHNYRLFEEMKTNKRQSIARGAGASKKRRK